MRRHCGNGLATVRKYAGIGSRETPPEICAYMMQLAIWLSERDWLLRSGGARGADQAFEAGAYKGSKDIFTKGAEIYRADTVCQAALELAAKYHPAWHRCDDYAKRLHARNGYIVLGPMLNDPVDLIICWTPRGDVTGGTGQALRIAEGYNIPIYNLGRCATFAQLEQRLNQ